MNQQSFVSAIFTGFLISLLCSAHSAETQTTSATQAANSAPASALTWLTDLPRAQAQAKQERKLVLLFFHGSDWCPTCAEMQKQVFDSTAFANYARKMLVLVDVDFPEKQKQSADLQRANLALKARFNLSLLNGEGFPTLVLLADSGETLFQETGYFGGGPAEVLAKLQHHAGLLKDERPIAAGSFKDLDVEEFADMVGDKANMILDVRTAKEFNTGHIPGAINMDVNSPDFLGRAAALNKNKVYLVHCASGVRSMRACEELAALGFPQLYNLSGGMRAWLKAKKPVSP